MTKLRIALATSEIYPFSKAGGLADVSAALGRYLFKSGHDIRIFSPLYASIDTIRHRMTPVEFARQISLDLGPERVRFSLLTSQLPGSRLWVYFVHCPRFFDRPEIYSDDREEPLRYAFLSRAVFASCQRMGFAPEILHCNDWPTALIPLLKGTLYSWDSLFRGARTLLTIHNIGYQGLFPSSCADALLPRNFHHLLHQGDLGLGVINFLKTGLLYADAVSTVSPTYAREIQTGAFGAGLEGLLEARRDSLVGILNGVDTSLWSPDRDPNLPNRYTPRGPIGGKRKNQKALCCHLDLLYQPRQPLVAMISRLVMQKGIDLLFDCLPRLLSRDKFRLVVLGSGEARFEDFFRWLQEQFPRRAVFHSGYSDTLAHWIEAAADIFLMPSHYEPCGLNQMYSLRYGTIPVARKTGGLADTIEPFDPQTGRGTGFLFHRPRAQDLQTALEKALRTFQDRKSWRRLVRNAMEQDFSWERQILEYERLYRRMVSPSTLP